MNRGEGRGLRKRCPCAVPGERRGDVRRVRTLAMPSFEAERIRSAIGWLPQPHGFNGGDSQGLDIGMRNYL